MSARVLWLTPLLKLTSQTSPFAPEDKVLVARVPKGILATSIIGELLLLSRSALRDEEMIVAAVHFLEREKKKDAQSKIGDAYAELWNTFLDPTHFELPPDHPNCRCVIEDIPEPWEVRLEMFGNTDPRIEEFKK